MSINKPSYNKPSSTESKNIEISKIKSNYGEEWLAINVSQNQDGNPIEGKVVIHEPDQNTFFKKVKDRRKGENAEEHLYWFFNGSVALKEVD
ncbi:MAG: hypothetical protein J7647_04215 [Cyanobacteria bacterium SBLK]|nr:hypothetical protein [Cyanobacteria bacterium SBLK]